MWWLLHPIDGIISSFGFTLPSTCLNYPFSFLYHVLCFVFGLKVRYADDDPASFYVHILGSKRSVSCSIILIYVFCVEA